ncbi:MAG: flagellar biosynthesis anti-sigma factor FlgM [Aureliella sp.]
MQIHSLQHSQATQSVNSTQNARAASQNQPVETSSAQQADQLDLSPEALALGQTEATAPAVNVDGIRTDKVAAIKQAIADGTYETPEKLSLALDKMLDSFA